MMMTSLADGLPSCDIYPELAGARVLVTGLGPTSGVDIARAFADHGARLVLQTSDTSAEMQAVLEMLAHTASDIGVFHEPLQTAAQATSFARMAVGRFGGLDVVVNLIPFDLSDLEPAPTMAMIEEAIAARIRVPYTLMRVAANRMQLTWTEGSIVNVLTTSVPRSRAEASFAALAGTVLATMTRVEAGQRAAQAVRINAIVPGRNADWREPVRQASGPEIANLTLLLASRRGKNLSGLSFDSDRLAGER
ncbi:MAG: SDR family oxidoreductase [Hyphomicrobiaceae bacterium]